MIVVVIVIFVVGIDCMIRPSTVPDIAFQSARHSSAASICESSAKILENFGLQAMG